MQETHCPKNFGKLLSKVHSFFSHNIFSCFIGSGAPHNTDNSKDEKKEGHDTGTKSEVDEAHIECLKALNLPSEKHDQWEGKEEEHALPGGNVPVVGHGVHHMVNTKTAPKGWVKTEYEEEL